MSKRKRIEYSYYRKLALNINEGNEINLEEFTGESTWAVATNVTINDSNVSFIARDYANVIILHAELPHRFRLNTRRAYTSVKSR